jgi:hypothetical protein
MSSLTLLEPFVNVRQVDDFDCGIACLLSVLASLADDDPRLRASRQQLLDAVQTRSIWTVDLAVLLVDVCRFELSDVAFFTSAPEAPASHADLAFYARDDYANEAMRINAAFAKARALGIAIGEPVSQDAILSWLDGDHCVILLVGALLLDCCSCDELRNELVPLLPESVVARLGFSSASLTPLFKRPDGAEAESNSCDYQGHFITLVGVDRVNELVFFANPSKRRVELCCMSFATMERARRQRGTDEDVIRIRVRRKKETANTES